MNIFTSSLIEGALSAQMIEEIATTGYIYMGWLKEGQDETSTECRICRIEKGTAGGNTQYYTKWANGNKEFAHSWANRASLTYSFHK